MQTYVPYRSMQGESRVKSIYRRSLLFAWATALTLVSCGKETATAAPDDTAIAAAVADSARPEADRERDESRKSEAMLTFMEVKRGLSIFEIESGDGYLTELFSRAVGDEGAIVMQNPKEFRSFMGERIDARLAEGRLPNVRASYSPFDALDADDASMDLVTWVWGPHELYCRADCGDVAVGDAATAYSEIFRILRPGGVFVVIDHAAAEGSLETTGNDLHRIDPAIVKRMAGLARFVLEAEGDFLVNPDDPLSVSIEDIQRDRTSQFTLRFRKPE